MRHTEPSLKPVQALNRLADVTTGYCGEQAFNAARKLGLFEEISEGAATAEELAGRVNIHPVGCRRLLMALAKRGLVVRDGGVYRNSEPGQYCSFRSAVNLAPLSVRLEPFYHMFEYLPDAILKSLRSFAGTHHEISSSRGRGSLSRRRIHG